MPLTHVNPPTLHVNQAFSQGVLIEPPGSLLIVGGQDGTDASGAIVPGGLREQTAQALRNVLAVLAAAGCTQEHVAKMTIHVVAPADIMAGFAASQEVWGKHPTAITVLQVAALGRPEALVEIDAIAQVPAV
jgi:enamine deaminase RidA (YjgF/YER057c/UK114 family)